MSVFIRNEDGHDRCLEWDDGITAHFAPHVIEKFSDPDSSDMYVNVRLPGGGRVTLALPFTTVEDIQKFIDFFQEEIDNLRRMMVEREGLIKLDLEDEEC